MSLNSTPSGERIHIGFFGLMNVGKSSLINAVTSQELSLVSEVPGTTTDPVRKAMELLPLGPVVLIDTAGLDDSGTLGEMRVKRARKILNEVDIAVLVTEADRELKPAEQEMIALFQEKRLPYIVARNKADLLQAENTAKDNIATERRFAATAGDSADASTDSEISATSAINDTANTAADSDTAVTAAAGATASPHEIYVSALSGLNIHAFKEKLGEFAKLKEQKPHAIVTDLLEPGDVVILVIPIDESAPKGRLILPQQQVMRELLDAHYTFVTCQPEEVPQTIRLCGDKLTLVITDSQKFEVVKDLVPDEIRLTSFSILFARYKGSLKRLLEGAAVLGELQDGDRVLISEGCTHHRQCNDIGTVKLPGWIRKYCGANPQFDFTSGRDFPEDLAAYRLIVHCGGCMLNEKEMQSRIGSAKKAGVPLVNYGIAIAQMNGILERSVSIFSSAACQTTSGK